MAELAFEVSNVAKYFGDVKALEGVSLKAEKGKVFGCLLAANLIAWTARYALMGWSSFAYFSLADSIELALFICATAAGILVNTRKPIIAILALLIVLNFIDPISTLLER